MIYGYYQVKVESAWYDTETDDCSIEEIRKATHGVIQFDYQLNAKSPNDVITVTITKPSWNSYYKIMLMKQENMPLKLVTMDYQTTAIHCHALLNDWATVTL